MDNLNGTKLLKILLIKIFTSDIINAIVNVVLPVFISIWCVNFQNKISWWIPVIIIFVTIVFFNITTVIMKSRKSRQNMLLNIVSRCYNDQMVINARAANNIYRLNKTINTSLKDNKPLNNKKIFDKIADFQTISFTICESIYQMLVSEYGNEIKCEVTLMKKNIKTGTIKMVAFSNNENKIPSSYSTTFYTNNNNDIFFVKLFEDLNGNIVCIPNKEQINIYFKKLNGSEKREDEICQYIGIPIKTNRNNIELLLQVDVSKEKVFGKNEEEILLFAKNILYPYAVLLHKSYERDLIFNQYYELLISLFSNKK